MAHTVRGREKVGRLVTGTGGGRIILQVDIDRGAGLPAKGLGLKRVSIICLPAKDPSSFVLYLRKRGRAKNIRQSTRQESPDNKCDNIRFTPIVGNDFPVHAGESGVAADGIDARVHGPESL